MSIGGGKNNSSDIDTGDLLGAGIDMFTSKGWANKLMALAIPAVQLGAAKLEKDILKTVAKEFITGYAKWKAISLGIKAVKMFLNKKEKKD